jgi:hypothetical protein
MNSIIPFCTKSVDYKAKKLCRCSWSSIFNFQCSVLLIIICPFVNISPHGHETPCGLLMNVFLLSTPFVKSTRHLHWFLVTRLAGNLTRVKRTFNYLVLAKLDHIMLHQEHLVWSWFELTTLLEISTYWIGR